jgi:hypothetical protein
MFVPCIIGRSRNDQNITDFTTPLFYIQAPTCFGSSLPSSGSFLDPSKLREIQFKWVVFHTMCGLLGLCAGFSWFLLLCYTAGTHII